MGLFFFQKNYFQIDVFNILDPIVAIPCHLTVFKSNASLDGFQILSYKFGIEMALTRGLNLNEKNGRINGIHMEL